MIDSCVSHAGLSRVEYDTFRYRYIRAASFLFRLVSLGSARASLLPLTVPVIINEHLPLAESLQSADPEPSQSGSGDLILQEQDYSTCTVPRVKTQYVYKRSKHR